MSTSSNLKRFEGFETWSRGVGGVGCKWSCFWMGGFIRFGLRTCPPSPPIDIIKKRLDSFLTIIEPHTLVHLNHLTDERNTLVYIIIKNNFFAKKERIWLSESKLIELKKSFMSSPMRKS